jgi:hypothetical protein
MGAQPLLHSISRVHRWTRPCGRLLVAFVLSMGGVGAIAQAPAAVSPPALAPGSAPAAHVALSAASGLEKAASASDQPWTKSFAELMQGIALVAAAIFFGWKWASGYHAFDMSLALATRRYRRARGSDLLVVSLILTKGTRESALLQSVRLHLSTPHDSNVPMSVEITDAQLVAANRTIRLTPGEATTFEHLLEIDPDVSVKVAAEVVATSGFFDLVFDDAVKGYWRCTAISVPEQAITEPKTSPA